MEINKRFAVLNGNVLALEDAHISVLSPAVKYAASVFEGLRGYWNASHDQLYLLSLDAHIKRLFESMKVMRFSHSFDPEQVKQWTLETVRAHHHRQDITMRILAYVDTPDGNQGEAGPVNIVVTSTLGGKPVRTGLNLCFSTWARVDSRIMPPRVKSVANYNNGRLAIMEAKTNGYDNALFLSLDGKVAESTGASLFLVVDGKLITPDVSHSILDSITRRTVLRIARERFNLEVIERGVDRSEVYTADEAFLCGTSSEIRPVASVDRITVNDGNIGPITQKLQTFYLKAARGDDATHLEWLTAVY